MWRIVLRLFLEVRFVTGVDNPEWGTALMEFAKTPTETQFGKRQTPHETGANDSQDCSPRTASVNETVLEALRLYPPTRRIHRAYNWGSGSETRNHSMGDLENYDPDRRIASDTDGSHPEGSERDNSTMDPTAMPTDWRMIAADVVACQRNVDIWGVRADEFNPQRWIPWTEERKDMKKMLLAFGSPPIECPAKRVFAPWMIGILVGALLRGLQGEANYRTRFWRLDCPDKKVMAALRAKKRLRLERDVYDDLELVGSF
ncbi:uncharacterized protein N7482_008061 [Penicillium canariense]|uniref:Uncharacterized protein n=1 Tax=Penicillium canariense TaxID=189055 RepID=A0A9W9HT19_9EURO|nr:uncharacterized protein N7482_008061 [Penicillium canariense]KAJ5156961.1 hypothetical protein N7482_008061 [Penicillium canariense]